MSTTGIPVITTSIAGQPITPISITSPVSGQALIHNGTNFSNSNLLGIVNYGGTRNSVITTFTLPTANVAVELTGIGMSSIVLNAGTYQFGVVITAYGANANGHLLLIKKSGAGTLASTSGFTVGYTFGENGTTTGGNICVYGSQFVGVSLSTQGLLTITGGSITLAVAAVSPTAGSTIHVNNILFYTIQVA